MEQAKYDVFISYSRKDYVDEQKNVISGNVISKIRDVLTDAGINYWFDEEGLFSGDEFAPLLAKAIKESKMFLFVSTVNSNESEWTSSEIATAHAYKKKIIPFLVDDSIYNDSVILYLAKLDYINYAENPTKAMSRLVCSIKSYLNPSDIKDYVIHRDINTSLKGFCLLDSLRVHVIKKHVLCIDYKPYYEDAPKQIIIYPHILKEFRNRWYIIGTEYQSVKILNLALDRIVSYSIMKDIPYVDNPEIDIMHYFDDVIGVSRSEKANPKEILFWVSKEKCNYIMTKPLHKSQMLLKDFGEKGMLFKINVIINLELFSVFMSLGNGIRILKPDKAVKHIQKELKHILELYEDDYKWIDSETFSYETYR